MQSLTIKIRLFPECSQLLRHLSQEYIRVVNVLTEQTVRNGSFPKVTTKDVKSFLLQFSTKLFVTRKVLLKKQKRKKNAQYLKNRCIT